MWCCSRARYRPFSYRYVGVTEGGEEGGLGAAPLPSTNIAQPPPRFEWAFSMWHREWQHIRSVVFSCVCLVIEVVCVTIAELRY